MSDDDCFATLLFRDNLTTSRPRRQFAEDEAMVRLWLSRLLQLTSLRIIICGVRKVCFAVLFFL